MHITYILKYLRVLKLLAKEQMTKEEWHRKFLKYSILDYYSDDGEDEGYKDSEVIFEHFDENNNQVRKDFMQTPDDESDS